MTTKREIGRLELLPVSEAVKELRLKKTKLYEILKSPDCMIDAYKPGGVLLIDMKTAREWFLSTKIVHKARKGAPRKR